MIRIVKAEDPLRDREDWLSRPAAERIAALELLRRTSYVIAGIEAIPRLEKVLSLRATFERTS